MILLLIMVMKMKALTNENYLNILNSHFKKSETVVCAITSSLTCPNCKKNKQNIIKFFETYENSKLKFYYVEYAKYDILQDYPEFDSLTYYPKTVVFYGNWKDTEFYEGVLTEEQLIGIHKNSLSNNEQFLI